MELFLPRKPSLLVGVIMNRKSVRRNSFKAFKASYFKNIIVAFIVIVILDGGYLYSTKNIIKDNNINVDTIKNNIYLDTDLTSQVVDPEKIVDLSKVSELIAKSISSYSLPLKCLYLPLLNLLLYFFNSSIKFSIYPSLLQKILSPYYLKDKTY